MEVFSFDADKVLILVLKQNVCSSFLPLLLRGHGLVWDNV